MWVMDRPCRQCIGESKAHQILTLTYHCALLPDQSKHVFSACLYNCIARCLCGDSSDMAAVFCNVVTVLCQDLSWEGGGSLDLG